MRIRFLLFNAYLGGGTVRTVFNTAGQFAERGHDVEVASLYRHRERTRFPVPPGVQRRPLTGQALRGWVGPWPDSQCPSSGTRRASPASERGHPAGGEQISGLTLTERDRDEYRELLGLSTRVVAIPNAVVVGRECSNQPRLDKVAGAAGRLCRQKGFDLLIDAWSRVAGQNPDWRLHIYGSGPRRGRLQAGIDRLGVSDRIHLMGFCEQLEVELSRASMFVLSSRFEGFPMVLIEAMNLGTPVVTYDCPTGPAEVVEDGVTGLLVKARSVPALAAAINRAIEDPQLRESMGAAGRERVCRLDTDAISQRWQRLLDELDGGGRKSARTVGRTQNRRWS